MSKPYDIFSVYPGIINTSNNPVVLEIGVGTGEDTGRLMQCVLERRKPYRFLAFEAEAKNLPKIVARNLPGEIELHNIAIADRNGLLSFTPSENWALSGSLKQPKDHLKSYPWLKFAAPVEVPALTLDAVFALNHIDHADFIWCDVQGAEDLVISGAQDALRRTRYFYCEIYETEEYADHIGRAEALRRLPGNWKIVHEWGDDVLFQNLDFK